MTESAALLVDEVLPRQPLRQWVLSLPFALRFLLATDPKVLTQVLGIAYRTIASPSHQDSGPIARRSRPKARALRASSRPDTAFSALSALALSSSAPTAKSPPPGA